MKGTRYLGLILLCMSGALYFGAGYIEQELIAGKVSIEQGKKTVSAGDKLFSQSPFTKRIGEEVTGSAQKKIDAGQAEITKYEKIASLMHISSVVTLVVGLSVLIYSMIKKYKGQ